MSTENVPGAITVTTAVFARVLTLRPPYPWGIQDRPRGALDGPPPEAASVVDARDRVVTPGLIDAHLHAYTVSLDLLENEALPMRRAGNPYEQTDVLWSPQRLVVRSGRVVEA